MGVLPCAVMPAPLSTSVTTAPKDIAAELGLTVGIDYAVQYQGTSVLRVRKDDSTQAPARTAEGQELESGSQSGYFVTPEAGLGVWCWCLSGAGGRVVLEAT